MVDTVILSSLHPMPMGMPTFYYAYACRRKMRQTRMMIRRKELRMRITFYYAYACRRKMRQTRMMMMRKELRMRITFYYTYVFRRNSNSNSKKTLLK